MEDRRRRPNQFTPKEEDMLIKFVKIHELLYNPRHELYKNQKSRYRLWYEISSKMNKSSNDCMKKWATIRDYYVRMRLKVATTNSTVSDFVRRRMQQLSFLEIKAIGKRESHTQISDVTSEVSQTYEVLELEEPAEEQTEEQTDLVMPEDGTEEPEIYFDIDVSPPPETLFNAAEFADTTNHNHHNGNNIDQNCNRRKKRITASTAAAAAATAASSNNMERLLLKKMLATDKKSAKSTGLEHFFASICDTVAKFPALRQAEIKMEISQLVGKAEIELLQPVQQQQFNSLNEAATNNAAVELKQTTLSKEPPEVELIVSDQLLEFNEQQKPTTSNTIVKLEECTYYDQI